MPMYVTIQEEKFEMSITSVSASFSAVVWGASIPTYGSSHSLSTALINKVEAGLAPPCRPVPTLQAVWPLQPAALTSAACYPRYLARDLSVSYPTL